MCATKLLAPLRLSRGILVLIQIVISVVFMSVFKFPKEMIAVFVGFILVGTMLSAWLKPRQMTPRPPPQIPSSHPIAFRVLSLFVGFAVLGIISILLFGFVIFMNNWTRWQQYQGQPYHRAEFVVTRTYYQKHSKGGADIYASGTVEGQKEWMSLGPFPGDRPRNEAELNDRVPEGTSIPIYLFPGMKGRMRVEVYSETPIAEGYHRAAIVDLNIALRALAAAIALLFLLILTRRAISNEDNPTPAVPALQ
jgi:hypothetical protein